MNLSEIDAQLEALGHEPAHLRELRSRYRPAELAPEALRDVQLAERLAQVDGCLNALQEGVGTDVPPEAPAESFADATAESDVAEAATGEYSVSVTMPKPVVAQQRGLRQPGTPLRGLTAENMTAEDDDAITVESVIAGDDDAVTVESMIAGDDDAVTVESVVAADQEAVTVERVIASDDGTITIENPCGVVGASGPNDQEPMAAAPTDLMLPHDGSERVLSDRRPPAGVDASAQASTLSSAQSTVQAMGRRHASSIPPIDLPPDFDPQAFEPLDDDPPADGSPASSRPVSVPPEPPAERGSAVTAVNQRAALAGAISGQYAVPRRPLTRPPTPTSAQSGAHPPPVPTADASVRMGADFPPSPLVGGGPTVPPPPPPRANMPNVPPPPRNPRIAATRSGEYPGPAHRPTAVPPPPPQTGRPILRSVAAPAQSSQSSSGKPPPPPIPRASSRPARATSVLPLRPDQTAEVDLSELIEIDD